MTINPIIIDIENKLKNLREYKLCMQRYHCEYDDGNLELIYEIALDALKEPALNKFENMSPNIIKFLLSIRENSLYYKKAQALIKEINGR